MTITAPTDIANCSLWLKADTGITQGTATGRVSAWADQSGAGNHFAQVTANKQPHIYDDPIFGKRVAFNPTLAEPHFLTSSLPVNTQSFSVFVVHRIANCTQSNIVPLFNNSSGAGNGALINFNYIPCIYNAGAIRYSTKRMNSMFDFTGYCAGSDGVDLYVNHTKTALGALSAENTTYASLGRWSSDPDVFYGDMIEVFAYSRKLTANEQTDVLDYIRFKHGIVPHTVNAVLLGDSISQGVGATESRTLPMFLEKQLPSGVRLINYGVSGRTWDDILAAVTPESVVSGQRNIMIGFAGTNDIALAGASATQANADRIAVFAPYVTAGWETMSVHMLPRETGYETKRLAYNALLSESTISAVATFANYPQLETGFLTNGLTSDNIHPNSVGYAALSRPIGEAFSRLVDPSSFPTLRDVYAQAMIAAQNTQS